MNIHRTVECPRSLIINRNAFKPVLENRSAAVTADIEPGPVACIQPLHRPADISFRRLYKKMIMVVHKNIRMQYNPVSFNHPGKQLNEMFTIPRTLKYCTTAQPTGCFVVPTPGNMMS